MYKVIWNFLCEEMGVMDWIIYFKIIFCWRVGIIIIEKI